MGDATRAGGGTGDDHDSKRQMTIITAEFNKDVSECHGDSGSGVFLAKSDGAEYDQSPERLPEKLEIKDGFPILVGLVSQYPVTKLSGRNAPCGHDIGANAYEATRVDYYHDWIIAEIKEMQEVIAPTPVTRWRHGSRR